MEVCDVVAFVSEADSMISPSEGVDGDLDRCDVMASQQSRRSTESRLSGIEIAQVDGPPEARVLV
jgi:hypothetical protein